MAPKSLLVAALSISCVFGTTPNNAIEVGLTQGTGLTGPAGFRATLLKHGRHVPAELDETADDPSKLVETYMNQLSDPEKADLKNQSGSTPTTTDPNQGYTAPFTIGNSTLDILIDTGSSDFWVYSHQLPRNETQGHKLYDTSTGKKLSGYSWEIMYGDDATAAGLVYRDSVRVGDATATSQAVEVATSISSKNAYGKSADGIIGLAFKNLNQVKPKKQNPLWETLAPSLQQKVFTAAFTKTGGSFEFGRIDPSKYEGQITYTPVAPATSWNFNLTEFEFNGTTYKPIKYKSNLPDAFIDTGTTNLVISRPAADKYYEHVHGAKKVDWQWVFPCSSKLPPFGLKIGGKYFYVYEDFLKQPLLTGICYGAIQGAEGLYSKYEADIIGTPFIAGNYVIFDFETPRLGFAVRSAASEASS